MQIDGTQTLLSDGVSVAFISSAQIEYRAAPAPKPVTPAKKKPAKKSRDEEGRTKEDRDDEPHSSLKKYVGRTAQKVRSHWL